MSSVITRYGARWSAKKSELEIELACYKNGGRWAYGSGTAGNGLEYHYERIRNLLWPHLDTHRWHELCRDTICQNRMTVLMGPKSSGKTHEGACFALIEYFAAPNDTTVLVSSTDIRGLELRVFGEIKKLFAKATELHPWLPGHLVDSKHAIMTDPVSEEEIRDWRNAIVGIPCIVNGKFIGLSKYIGIKNKRVRLIADELQFMGAGFLDSIGNLDGNPDFKAIMLGNPNDPSDALGKSAEPKDGWASMDVPEKTTVYTTRFMSGKCVNLVGTDSPNFDQPGKPRFPYLINQDSIDSTVTFYGKDSLQYSMFCQGVMRSNLVARRVVTRKMAEIFNAQEELVWSSDEVTRIYAVDAAYGSIGGDRCIGGSIKFGKCVDGMVRVLCSQPKIIPVRLSDGKMPEDSIAEFVKRDCDLLNIPPENVFYDSTGRGSLGTAFARTWSALVNPVEFGGIPSERPVSLDLYIYDPKLRARRLKLCVEHYSKRVTEFWFSVRYVIESGQMRGLTNDVLDELCAREWKMTKGARIEIEKKEEMKERFGRSPDLADWLATAIEGARQRGLQISKLSQEERTSAKQWLEDLQTTRRRELTRTQLVEV